MREPFVQRPSLPSGPMAKRELSVVSETWKQSSSRKVDKIIPPVVDVLDFMDKESVANSQKSWEKTNRSFSQFFNEAATGIKVNPSLSIANPNQGFLLPKKSLGAETFKGIVGLEQHMRNNSVCLQAPEQQRNKKSHSIASFPRLGESQFQNFEVKLPSLKDMNESEVNLIIQRQREQSVAKTNT